MFRITQGVKGGTATPKHILRAARLEEDPGVSHSGRGATCSLWARSRSQSSAAGCLQPCVLTIGLVRSEEIQRARSRTGQTRVDGQRGGKRRSVETLGDRSGRLFFSFLFFWFLSSPMWKRHSARRKTGADRTQRQRDGWAAYPPPDLKERRRKRLRKGRLKNGEVHFLFPWGKKREFYGMGRFFCLCEKQRDAVRG